MKNSSCPLLRHLDNPIRVLSLSINDLVIYGLPFFIGSLFDSLFVMPAIGLGIVYLGKKAIKGVPKFYMVRYLYWSLPTKRFNRIFRVGFQPSNQRFWSK